MTAGCAESMRLFYALWPDDAARAALQRLQARIAGRPTRYENLHVTLAFLGQQPATLLPILKKILADLPAVELPLQLDRIGYFPKSRIAWAGMHQVPDSLYTLQKELCAALKINGIAFDHQARFTPHVTLARDAELPPDTPFDTIAWQASQAVLVHSVQTGGNPAYRVLATRLLH